MQRTFLKKNLIFWPEELKYYFQYSCDFETMDSPFFATPVARQGPTSRLLKRRSEKPATPQMEPSFTTTPTGPIRKGNTTNVSFAVPFTSRTYKPSMTMGEQDAWEATRFVTTISPATVIIANSHY